MSDLIQAGKPITTYMERSLHAHLKKVFCPDEGAHEVKVGRYVADACDGKTVFEIQTGNLAPLAKKINFYLENTDYSVAVVRPLAQKRRLYWLDGETGEFTGKSRFTAKHESISSGISDLFYLKDLLGNERVSFIFVLMEIDEIRLLDGYGKYKKTRATSVDRLAGEIFEVKRIGSAKDIADCVLPLLPDGPFTRDELAKSLKLKGLKLWSAQKLLLETGVLSVEKVKNRLIFEKCEGE
ncbi:MAG: hypothetical protein ACI3XL_06735 [Eubacteriales bacterium]